MQNELFPNLLPFLIYSGLVGLMVALGIAGAFALLYYTVFRSLIRTWHVERARNQPYAPRQDSRQDYAQFDEEHLVAIVRKEVRDELIRKGIR